MKKYLIAKIIIISFCLISYSNSQLVEKKSISLELAKRIAIVSESEAIKNKLTSVIAILDDGGNLVYLERMDNTQIGSIEVAIAKARTAIYFKRSTKIYEDQVTNGRNALLGVPNIIPIEGGLPIIVNGQIIGAIGVSGGTPQQDGVVAKAGADLVVSLSENKLNNSQNIRPEHIAFNIPDPKAMAKWYVKNLGMKIMREGAAPNFTTFIADKGEHIMFELNHASEFPLFDLPKINHMSFHFAFMVSNIKTIKEKLISENAILVEDIKSTASGDKVLMLRDPWGLPIQFVERVKPMMDFAELRPEHFALNLIDSRAKVKWYVENLNMKVIKEGNAPTYGSFIEDLKDNLMMELYQNSEFPIPEYEKIDCNSFHFAFIVEDINAIKEKILSAGGKLVEDIKKIPSGDQVLMMRDPFGQPLQFVKRVNPMIK